MNSNKKDLDTWGRSKARQRYADGGYVDSGDRSLPRMEHPNMGAARATLGHQMRNTKGYDTSDREDPSWRRRNPNAEEYGAFGRDMRLLRDEGVSEIKRGGRIKR